MSLRKKEERTVLLSDKLAVQTKRTSHLLLVLMMMLQLIFPVVLSVSASSEDDAIEPTTVEVQAQEDNSDADIESAKSLSVSEEPAEEVEEVKEPETPPAPAPEEKEEPAENVVDEPVNDPKENTKEEANAPPTPETPEKPKAPEAKPEQKSEPAPEPEEKVEEVEVIEEVEEDVEEEAEVIVEFDPEQMLDGFPPMMHPNNPTPIKWFLPGAFGSRSALRQNNKNIKSTTILQPGEVRTSKTAKQVPGMVNTWDITVRIEGRDREIVETTDVVLVIDRSGSMDDNNRMNSAKSAAKNFIDTMLSRDANLRIGIVSFSSDYSTSNPPRSSNLVDVNSGFTNVAADLKNAVDSLFAFGGTHTQAGIMQGQALFGSSAEEVDNKYMVLLSDGEPTFSYAPTGWVTVNEQKRGYYSQDRGIFTYSNEYGNGNYNTNSVVGTGNTMVSSTTQHNGNTWPRTISGTEYYPLSRSGSSWSGYTYNPVNLRYIDNGRAAIHAANTAKNNVDGLFTIAVEAGIAGTAVLNSIATPGMAYSTNNPNELTEIYNRIATQISRQYALRSVKLVDEMGDGFSLVAGTIQTTKGDTAVANPSAGINQKITWTINDPVMEEVPNEPGVRYAEMTYRVEINDGILALDGAKTDEHKLFDTNKKTELSYKDINDDQQTKSITSPKVDPVLLKMKKNLLDADPNEERVFNVEVSKASPDGFNHTESLVPNADYVWLTSLRHEGTYGVAETGISGPGITDLNQFITTYEIDGVNKTNFTVNHLAGIPRGDITIEVTNREIALINITATKVWDGGPNVKPDIQLQLYRNGTAYGDPVTLENGTTSYTWTDLDEADSNGNAYVYTVQEVADPDNYNSVADGLIVTNTYIIPTTGTASATKVWEGGTADEYYEIDLTLWRTKDGLIFLPVEDFDLVVTASADGTTYNYEWSNLETTDFQGNPYTFYFTEDEVPDGFERIYSNPLMVGDVDYQKSGGKVTNRKMVTDFSFTKTDELGNPLTGAEFTLESEDGEDSIANTGTNPEFIFAGLTEGRYILRETKAPTGYSLPTTTWIIEVIRNEAGALEIVIPDDSFLNATEEGNQLVNKQQGEFPQTGGIGVASYIGVGMLAIMSSIGFYIKKEKNGGYQNE